MLEQIPQLRVEVERQVNRELLVGGRWIDDFASANYLGDQSAISFRADADLLD